MTILTDEIIEKAARAIYTQFLKNLPDRDDLDIWDDRSPDTQDHYRSGMRAALSAILPDVIEECAKVAEAYECGSEGWDCGAIAPRIRSLLKEKLG